MTPANPGKKEGMKQKETIKICSNHVHRVPLIWTFKFYGCEYWCPYCGYTGGMFGSGKNVPITKALLESYEIYKAAASDFLSSDSLDGWKYNVRVTQLKKAIK